MDGGTFSTQHASWQLEQTLPWSSSWCCSASRCRTRAQACSYCYPLNSSKKNPPSTTPPLPCHHFHRDIQTLHPHVTATLTSVRASALFYAADQPAHRTRMHCLRCHHAGAYLDTVPVSPSLRVSDAEFICVVSIAWEPQAPTPASQPRLTTLVNACKAATKSVRLQITDKGLP